MPEKKNKKCQKIVVGVMAVLVQGMVDPGEVVTTTVKREFIEEAMDSLALSEDDQKRINQQISDFFKIFTEVSEQRVV